jgi:hypothetical protein
MNGSTIMNLLKVLCSYKPTVTALAAADHLASYLMVPSHDRLAKYNTSQAVADVMMIIKQLPIDTAAALCQRTSNSVHEFSPLLSTVTAGPGVLAAVPPGTCAHAGHMGYSTWTAWVTGYNAVLPCVTAEESDSLLAVWLHLLDERAFPAHMLSYAPAASGQCELDSAPSPLSRAARSILLKQIPTVKGKDRARLLGWPAIRLAFHSECTAACLEEASCLKELILETSDGSCTPADHSAILMLSQLSTWLPLTRCPEAAEKPQPPAAESSTESVSYDPSSTLDSWQDHYLSTLLGMPIAQAHHVHLPTSPA